MNTSILVVEDEEDVAGLVAMHLRNAGFAPILVGDGPSAIECTRNDHPALVILDLMLPGMTGFDVCKVLRGDPRTSTVPVLMLTARTQECDRVQGLELGADDYLTKPFSPRELVLRIKSILRRFNGYGQEKKPVVAGPITLNAERHTVHVKNRPIPLTATEFKLLALLLERRGQVQSREQLLLDIWGGDDGVDPRTVDTHIRRLREKLGCGADLIETIRGVGYRLDA